MWRRPGSGGGGTLHTWWDRPPRWGFLLHPGISTHTELWGRASEGTGSAPQDSPQGKEDEEKHEALPPFSEELELSTLGLTSKMGVGVEKRNGVMPPRKDRQCVDSTHLGIQAAQTKGDCT